MEEQPSRKPDPTDGVALIAAERRRQVEVKGYDAKADDRSVGGLADIAAILVTNQASNPMSFWAVNKAEHITEKWGNDRIKILIIAGALIAAEIDRLQRQNEKRSEP